MAALSVEQALARVLDGATPLPAETVDILDAHGRVLAGDVAARLTQPPFAASAMDGYAVNAADVADLPAVLTVVGEAAAGARFSGRIGPCEAVRIFTGAPVPDGADAIVIQENTSRDGASVVVRDGRPEPAHIRPAGGDFTRGQVLLKAGRTLDARAIALAAAAGHGTLDVRRRPRIAILATGNELVPPGLPTGPDQIVSSNPAGLAAMVRAYGGEPILLGIARDELADLEAHITMASHADIIVTTGGASVGDHDLVRPALARLGMTLDFWNIAMRPGKPLLFGRLGRQRVLGLPGNPVSAIVTARIFLVPLMAALLGRPTGSLDEVSGVLATGVEANGPRQHYMRASLEAIAGTFATVTPAANQDSSLLTPLAECNALIVRPPNAPALARGAYVPVLRLDF